MQPIDVFVGDDLPTLYCQATDGESGTAIDLSAASTVISAKFRLKGGTTVLATATCDKLFGGTNGRFSMDWSATQLDVDPGLYEIEISIAFNSAVQTANNYYWENGMRLDNARVIPVRVRDDF